MKFFKKVLSWTFAAVFLGACSKNEYIPKSEKESAYAMLSKGGLELAEVKDIAGFQEIPLAVSVSMAKDLKKDLAITIDLDEAALTEYNARYLTEYKMIPAGAVQLATSVTIPGGSSTINVPLSVNVADLIGDPRDYVIPVSIRDAKSVPIDKNYGTVLYRLNRPDYTGDFAASGSRKAVQADGTVFLEQIYEPPTHDKALTRIEGNTYSISKVSNLAIQGTQVFKIEILDDNSVTVTGTYGGFSFLQIPNEPSYFVPAEKKLVLNYYYVIPAGDTYSTREMREVLIKK
ncbi:MAG: DUF1735 domain-containing protein [Niabella sp.]